MREIIKIRRMDEDDLDERETLLDIYKRALGTRHAGKRCGGIGRRKPGGVALPCLALKH